MLIKHIILTITNQVCILAASQLTKVSEVAQKLCSAAKKCAITGKRQNCAKTAQCKIAIFKWVYLIGFKTGGFHWVSNPDKTEQQKSPTQIH